MRNKEFNSFAAIAEKELQNAFRHGLKDAELKLTHEDGSSITLAHPKLLHIVLDAFESYQEQCERLKEEFETATATDHEFGGREFCDAHDPIFNFDKIKTKNR